MDDPDDWQALADRREEAFWDAARGRARQPIPAYQVTTDPDGAFVIVWDKTNVDPIGASLIAGDVRHRMVSTRPGEDAFAGMRVPWSPTYALGEDD